MLRLAGLQGFRRAHVSIARRWIVFLLICSYFGFAGAQQQPIKLWPKGAPGVEGSVTPETVRLNADGEHILSNIQEPSITPYPPPKAAATGGAVIVAPGGGHSELWMDHEGYAVAEWLSNHGIAAFVLKYRLAREPGSTYTVEGTELQNMQRAIRLVRSRAAEWGVDPNRVGVMGFSAGGELAALASTRYDSGNPNAPDPIDRQSSKPAFQALLYPAIPGNMPLSKENPPAFLACGADDRQNISEGLPELYLAMKRAGASAELHVYARTGHGFGVRPTNHGPSAAWTTEFHAWLEAIGMLRKPGAQ